MNATQWGGFAAVFLASAVEWVEAFTIVLAVALSIGWAGASGAALAALALVAALIAATGAGLAAVQADIGAIRIAIGVFLLLFGLRWYVKAVRRYCGRTKLHDEDQEFRDTREALSHAERHAAWLIAFKGVLLEGLEVWLLVVALGHNISYGQATAGALAALLAVIAAGALLRHPLNKVPENTMKFIVACALLAFGSFWTIGGLFDENQAWQLGDITLVVLFAVYFGMGRLMGASLSRPVVTPSIGA
ncbi:MAG: High-affinity Fe2+/Pb2+ permease [Burkholderiales bacterium]|nr:High-affinity Fe2+/Pb2+ permease [Burkholderiales bacterium]